MIQLTVRRVGNSLGMILPLEAATLLHVAEGDTVFLTETPEGFRITPYDPQFEAAMTSAAEVMKRYRNALRELGK
jgi:putative addiction module antidote